MTILHTIIIGIVEGLTEFLPISSTAHMMITSKLLGLDQTHTVKSFEIAIQLGAILAAFSIFLKDFFKLKNIKELFVGFLPTAILGLLFYKIIKNYFFGNYLAIAISLIVGGVIIILVENYVAKRYKSEKYKNNLKTEVNMSDSVKLGFAQSVALMPGVSRSGAIIIAGLLMNIKREVVMKYAFMLAVPTMAAATFYDLLKSYKELTSDSISLIAIGFVFAFITAYFTVGYVLRYVRNHDFKIFGYYRIILGVLILIFFLN